MSIPIQFLSQISTTLYNTIGNFSTRRPSSIPSTTSDQAVQALFINSSPFTNTSSLNSLRNFRAETILRLRERIQSIRERQSQLIEIQEEEEISRSKKEKLIWFAVLISGVITVVLAYRSLFLIDSQPYQIYNYIGGVCLGSTMLTISAMKLIDLYRYN